MAILIAPFFSVRKGLCAVIHTLAVFVLLMLSVSYGFGQAPDFSVSVSAANLRISQAGKGSLIVTTGVTPGFESPISLSAQGLPPGATASFSKNTLSGIGASALTISVAGTMPLGVYSVTVTGTSATNVHQASLALTVTPAQLRPTGYGWHQLANTNMTSVCLGDVSNGMYTDPSMTSTTNYDFDCNQVVPWSGGVIDDNSQQLIVWGGGHTDYAGNEVSALNLNGTPSWQSITAPTYPVPYEWDGNEWEGLKPYFVRAADGGQYQAGASPASRHTYNSLQYVPNQNQLYSFGGAVANGGFLSSETWTLNLGTANWTLVGPPYSVTPGYPTTAYNPNTGHIIMHDKSWTLYDYNPASNTWTTLTTQYHINDGTTAVVDPVNNLFVVVGADGTTDNLSYPSVPTSRTVVVFPLTPPYAMQTWSDPSCDLVYHAGGLAWDSALGLVVGYPGGGNQVYFLNTGAQPVVTPFGTVPSHKCLDVPISQNPTPVIGVDYPQNPEGTLSDANLGINGRFGYFPSLDTFAMVNDVTRNAWTIQLTGGTPTPNFSVSIAPTLFVAEGGQATLPVSTSVSNGFNNPIALSAVGAPAGVTITFAPATMSAPGGGNSTMTVNVPASTPVGSYPIVVNAFGGGDTQNPIVTLNVTASGQPSFTLSATPAALSVQPGNQGSSTITSTISGSFNGALTLSTSGVPSGTTVTFAPNPIPAPGSGSSTMNIAVGASTPAGTYPITVTGNGDGVQQSTVVTLTVTAQQGPNFTLTPTPSSLTVQPGNQGSSTITSTISGGFNGAIALSASGVPSGTTVSFAPNPIAAPGSGNSTMSVTVGANTPAGTYPITVTGNGGGVQSTTTVTLTVSSQQTGFTLTASPSTTTVQQGSQGRSIITSTISSGFSGAIVFMSAGAPPGTTVTFSPIVIPAPGAGSTTMSITVGASTPTGTYPITVTGIAGSTQETTTVTLTVTAQQQQGFTLSASPGSLSIQQGNQGSSTITSVINTGFNGAVNLSASGIPSGTTVTFNPQTIPAPGSGNSAMSISVGASTPAGTYPLTITGISGGVQQNVMLTLTVTAQQQPNFTLTAVPNSETVQQGGHGTSTITSAISGGFNGSITLSTSGVPSGTTVSFAPNPIAAPGSGNSTMSITVGASTPTGTYPITVTGNGGGLQRTTTVTLTVTAAQQQPSFTLTAAPSSLTVPQGSQGTSTLTSTISGGFNAAITLSTSGVPSGTTVSFAPNPIAAPGSGNSIMSITVGASTATGTYPITVTGNGGGLQRTTVVTLTVTPQQQPNYALTAAPSSLTVQQGSQGNSTITSTISGGFNGAVTLSAAGVPSGTTVSFAPNPIAAPGSGNSTMSITVGASTATGTYPITVTGNGGGLQRTAIVTLTVTSAGGGGWQQGFDFRSTANFVTDPAGDAAVLATTAYPTRGSGVTYGWVATSLVQGRNRNSQEDPRLAGINFSTNGSPATFYVDLPSAGTYNLALAMGDAGYEECWVQCQIQFLDGSTVLATITKGVTGLNYFYDAKGNNWSGASWPTGNLSQQVTLAGSRLTVVVGTNHNTGDFTPIAFLGVAQASGGSPNYALTPAPGSLTVQQGSQGTSTITSTISGGFNGAITLSAAGAPSGTTVSFAPNPMAAPGSGNSTMSITVGASTATGTYPITVTGNGGGLQRTAIVTLTVTAQQQPNYALTPAPGSLTVQQGSQGTSTITSTISGGFNGAITLSAAGVPSGTTVSFAPNPIAAPGSGNSTMSITVGASTATGTYPITVTGNGGGLQRTAIVTLTVTAQQQPNYALTAAPGSLTVQQGSQGTSAITSTISGGFNGAITLSAAGVPSGTTVSFAPNPIAAPGSGNSTMSITVGASTATGTYPITVTGNGGGLQRTAIVTLTVTAQQQPGFTLTAAPGSLTVQQGSQGNSTITSTISGGFNGAITLSAAGAPSGTTVSFAPNPMAAPGSGNSTMSITVGASTATGTYPIMVTGNGGGLQQNTTVTLTVTSTGGGGGGNGITVYSTSGSSQTNRMVSIGRVFKDGDIPNFAQAVVAGSPILTQCDVKNRWPDGSLKFAIVSFIVPTVSVSGTQVNFQNQGTGNNTGFLEQSDMLNQAYDFDGVMQLTGTASPSISARNVLQSGNFTYWLQGPIVTAVILEDRVNRSFDVNTDGGLGDPLHPIFEAWFYPQTHQVELGFTLENSWASSTAANSARNQTYSLNITTGSSSPVTQLTQPSFTQNIFTRWRRAFWLDSAPLPIQINYNWAYLSTTAAYANFNINYTPNEADLESMYAVYTNEPAGRLTIPGIDNINGNGGIVNYDESVNAPGYAPWIGPYSQWDVDYLMTGDNRMQKMMTDNADLAGRFPIFFREADHDAGTGHYFDAPGNGSVDPYGHVVSINARQFATLNLANDWNVSCNNNSADLIATSLPGDGSGWYTVPADTSHLPDFAYVPYTLTGKFFYMENEMLEAGYAAGHGEGCYGATASYGRQGHYGMLYSVTREMAWALRTMDYAAFIAPDGTPEGPYFASKVINNIAMVEGEHALPQTMSGADPTWAYNWGKNYFQFSQAANPSTLSFWRMGDCQDGTTTCYVANGDGANNNLNVNVVQSAESGFMSSFIDIVFGLTNQLGIVDTTSILERDARRYLNILLNPAINHYLIEQYTYPTTLVGPVCQNPANPGCVWISDWNTFQTGYLSLPTGWSPRGVDYGAEAASALSFMTNFTVDGYNGLNAWNFFTTSDATYLGQVYNNEPQWSIAPMQ